MHDQPTTNSSGFLVSVETSDVETVLVVAGELDMASAPALVALVRKVGATESIVIDAAGVTFVDASGLRGLLGGQPGAFPGLRLRNPSPPVVRLLGLVGMSYLMERRSMFDRTPRNGTANNSCHDLASARSRAQLSMEALYVRYIGLGGLAFSVEVADHCRGRSSLPVPEHNKVVQAINERFLELGNSERVPFL